MKLPEFDFRYLWFIALIFWVHLFAVLSTVHAIQFMNAKEVSPISNIGFSMLGIVPTMALTTLIGFAMITAIPFTLKENAKLGRKSVIGYSVLFVLIGLDSLNDFLAITHNPLHLVTLGFFNTFFAAVPYLLCASLIVTAEYYCIIWYRRKTDKSAEEPEKNTKNTRGQP